MSHENGIMPNRQKDVETETNNNKLTFPKRIAFIVSNEFCERFMYYGTRTILVLYLTKKLSYDNDQATVTYHAWACLSYFCSLLGAIFSDSLIGKFKTIFYFSCVYAIGCLLISLGAVPSMNLSIQNMTLLGLILVALGTGGIKPCVCAFSGEQFKLPEQTAEVTMFFSMFYFIIYVGSLTSTIITPILRQDVKCFGEDDCFMLAWGLPGVLMIISVVIFVSFKSLYTMKAPSGNMVVLVSKCIGNGIANKLQNKDITTKTHWLDFAIDKYGQQLVADTKILLKILILYIPLPVFWALYDQQGSRWAIQATQMRGDFGSSEIILKPDQMQVLNPLLVLIFIPLFDLFVYPLLAKFGIRRPLQKMVIGGLFGALSFLLSGIVELELQKSYPIIPESNESQLRIFNTFPCDYTFQTNIPGHETFIIKSLEAFQDRHIPVDGSTKFTYNMTAEHCPDIEGHFTLFPAKATSFFGTNVNQLNEYDDDPSKSKSGDSFIRILANLNGSKEFNLIDLTKANKQKFFKYNGFTTNIERISVAPANYELHIDDRKIADLYLPPGSVTTILITEFQGFYNFSTIEISPPNTIHMFWLIPQYAVMTIGEVMFSVTGLHFSFAQAPESMKSVIQSCWLLTVAFGNLIDVIVVGAKIFDSQASEFFLFAGLMFVDMLIFMILAWRYKSAVDNNSLDNVKSAIHMNKIAAGVENPAFNKEE